MKYILLLLPLLTGCALLPDKDKTPEAAAKVGEPAARPQASIEAKQVAAEREADELAEVEFGRGKFALTKSESARLKKIEARLAKTKKKSDRIIVAAWADKMLPGAKGKELPAAAQDLAEKRAAAISDYLTKHGATDVEVHNMAKKPTEFAKFLSSDDARLKKSLEGARPSRAIILLIEKD